MDSLQERPWDALEDLPYWLKHALARWSREKKKVFVDEYRSRSKSVTLALILCLLIGAHYGYLRKWLVQILFWVTCGGLMIWWIIDFFRIPRLVRAYNVELARQIFVTWNMRSL